MISETSAKIQNVNDDAEGLVSISGVISEDNIISINTTQLKDDDGVGDLDYSWEFSLDGVGWQDLKGQNSSTIMLDDVHVGSYVRGVVSYYDGTGHFEEIVTLPEGPVAGVNDEAFGTFPSQVCWFLPNAPSRYLQHSRHRWLGNQYSWFNSADGISGKRLMVRMRQHTRLPASNDVSRYIKVKRHSLINKVFLKSSAHIPNVQC